MHKGTHMNEIGRKIVDKIIELHGSKDFSIAFLPYKRSMWNSMASVYEECIAAGIDAHCFPIPYARMKERGQIDYIDTDFELFGDIAEPIESLTRTDYIVIHYQYEDHNRVTNMLPEYFTMALKDRYQCKIIYIPYGIRMGTDHFVLHSGLCQIDMAFLESEEDAISFVDKWQNVGVDFTGRVFSFGSPKLDAAKKLEKYVPKEWAELIGNREVTLLVNSLGAYLTDPYQRIILYTKAVKEEIQRNRAVIFRPHPLLLTTIKSMRPETLWRYNQMIDEFKSLGVIVDESEYLERAMAASDRLITDPSSVLPMWEETGKPWGML